MCVALQAAAASEGEAAAAAAEEEEEDTGGDLGSDQELPAQKVQREAFMGSPG